jgi:hypothetical protein
MPMNPIFNLLNFLRNTMSLKIKNFIEFLSKQCKLTSILNKLRLFLRMINRQNLHWNRHQHIFYDVGYVVDIHIIQIIVQIFIIRQILDRY